MNALIHSFDRLESSRTTRPPGFLRRTFAALGAALRALHADRLDDQSPLEWDAVMAGLEQPTAERVAPRREHHDVYVAQRARYEEFERRALR